MELRSGKRLPSAPSSRSRNRNRNQRHNPQPFRLLDLPQELRLMIYGFAFGHQHVHWTMTYMFASGSGSGFMLVLGYLKGFGHVKHNINLQKRRSSLLQTCSQVSQEALPIFYNQTRFGFSLCHDDVYKNHSAYQLRLTEGRVNLSDGLARVVLQRVKHVRFSFRNNRRCYPYFWQMSLLRDFLGHGAWLKSLEFVAGGNVNFLNGSKWYAHRGIVDFESYRGTAILKLRDSNPTNEEVTQLKRGSKVHIALILHILMARS